LCRLIVLEATEESSFIDGGEIIGGVSFQWESDDIFDLSHLVIEEDPACYTFDGTSFGYSNNRPPSDDNEREVNYFDWLL
jgi:hypothetical protein